MWQPIFSPSTSIVAGAAAGCECPAWCKRPAETRVNAACAVLDVTDPSAVTKAADAIVAEPGKGDILVNSAAIARLNRENRNA